MVDGERDSFVVGPDTCWFETREYDPDFYTFRPEVYGPYPPEAPDDTLWYLSNDSLSIWVVKVEVDEELSDRILDVPVDEDDEAETPVRTVFRILPDLGSAGISFVESPAAAGVTYWHSVSYGPESGDEVVMKSEEEFVLDDLPLSDNHYTLEWEQKDDDANWLDPAHNPYTSRVTMKWERGETREPAEARGDLECDAAGVDLVVRLPDGSALPEAQEQAPGSGVFVVLNDEHPTGSTMGLGEWPAVMAKMVPIDVRISAQTIEEFALSQEGAYFELSIEGSGAECVKVWEFGMPSYDRMEVLLDGTEQEYVRRWYPRNSEDARELSAMVLGGIYLEGARGPSTHIRDWSLELRVKASEVSREKRDRVEGTIIGVDLYRGTTHWGANNMESGNMFLLGQPLGIEIEGLHGVASAEVRVCRGESPELVVSAALTETANNVFRNAGADRPVFGPDDDLTMGRIGIEDEEDIQVSLSINGAAAAFPIQKVSIDLAEFAAADGTPTPDGWAFVNAMTTSGRWVNNGLQAPAPFSPEAAIRSSDLFYLGAHGHSVDIWGEAGYSTLWMGPADLADCWGEDTDWLILAACSVLHIRETGQYNFGEGGESGDWGRYWISTMTGRKAHGLLGYRGGAPGGQGNPTDVLVAEKFVDMMATRSLAEAWIGANVAHAYVNISPYGTIISPLNAISVLKVAAAADRPDHSDCELGPDDDAGTQYVARWIYWEKIPVGEDRWTFESVDENRMNLVIP